MAMACARCGAQNPDGNAFCQACGAPLAPASPVAGPPMAPPGPPVAPPGPPMAPPPGAVMGPPAGMPPPIFAGSGYASPYYQPQGATVPVHRAPLTLIIAGVVALVVLMAGCGTAFAVLANRGGTAANGSSTIGDVPSPSPVGSPSPVASPTTSPTANGVESNDGVSVKLPAGWTVESKDSESIVLFDPNTEGEVTVASGASLPAASATDNMNEINNELKAKYPDTKNCPNTKTANTTFNGAKGLSWTLCFTLTDGSHSLPAAASMFAGANDSGSVYYLAFVLTRADNLSAYLTVAKPVLASVTWKLS